MGTAEVGLGIGLSMFVGASAYGEVYQGRAESAEVLASTTPAVCISSGSLEAY